MTRDVSTAPSEALVYTDDLTEADVVALKEFLGRRLRDVAERHPEGTDEHAAAIGFAHLVAMDGLQLQDYVIAWCDVEHRHEYPVPEQQLAQEIYFGWRHLCQAAAGWSAHEEFNGARWTAPRYGNARHREFVETAEAGAAERAEPAEDGDRTWRPKAHP
ncbi:hypothetical protein ACSNOK_00320 [Streptomyces sp. URMC 126]|uniref:hypothetical protein n=1 Tax=Streptomyces sp. URMC 126 TaxID=3423401 RepID=UPI003F1D797B